MRICRDDTQDRSGPEPSRAPDHGRSVCARARYGPEIQEGLPDQPNYSSVRTILRVLERKGYIRHVEEGLRYVYEPTVAREAASRSALQRIIETFFDGSAKEAVAALLDPAAFHLSDKELQRAGSNH